MDNRIEDQLDLMFLAVRSMNVIGFNQARKRLEGILDSIEPETITIEPDCPNPLGQVCSVSEYMSKADLSKMQVWRKIKARQLEARKSGGVWLIRMEKAVVL